MDLRGRDGAGFGLGLDVFEFVVLFGRQFFWVSLVGGWLDWFGWLDLVIVLIA